MSAAVASPAHPSCIRSDTDSKPLSASFSLAWISAATDLASPTCLVTSTRLASWPASTRSLSCAGEVKLIARASSRRNAGDDVSRPIPGVTARDDAPEVGPLFFFFFLPKSTENGSPAPFSSLSSAAMDSSASCVAMASIVSSSWMAAPHACSSSAVRLTVDSVIHGFRAEDLRLCSRRASASLGRDVRLVAAETFFLAAPASSSSLLDPLPLVSAEYLGPPLARAVWLGLSATSGSSSEDDEVLPPAS